MSDIYWSITRLLKAQIPLLIIIASVEIVAGIVLNNISDEILSRPTLLLLVPAFLALGGNLGITYGSRLSTAIHLGLLEFNIRNVIFKNNLLALSIASIVTFIILGIFVSLLSMAQGMAILFSNTILLTLIAGLILTSIIMPLALSVAYMSYRRSIDPDDVIVPIITAIADIIGMLALFSIIIVLL